MQSYFIEMNPAHVKKLKTMLIDQVKVLIESKAPAATIKAAEATRDEVIGSLKVLRNSNKNA